MYSPVCALRQSGEHSLFPLVDRSCRASLRGCGDSDNIGFASHESTARIALAVALLCAAQYWAIERFTRQRNVSKEPLPVVLHTQRKF
jgi:hypothetical protein